MSETSDWRAWHEPYADPSSPLSRRLRLIQGHLDQWLDERPDEPLTVVSVCAGQGHDVLGVLRHRADAGRVHATLLESDAHNVTVARAAAGGLGNVTVRQVDAGRLSAFAGTVPADLILLAGVLGNVADADVRRAIDALPRLCGRNATVIWTRARRAPDRTPAIRRWLAAAGFAEQAFHAPDDAIFTVGVHRFTGEPQPLGADDRIFSFARR